MNFIAIIFASHFHEDFFLIKIMMMIIVKIMMMVMMMITVMTMITVV